MMVAVNLIVDVDPQSYRDEYGTSDTPAEIREDIRSRVYEATNAELNKFFFINDIFE